MSFALSQCGFEDSTINRDIPKTALRIICYLQVVEILNVVEGIALCSRVHTSRGIVCVQEWSNFRFSELIAKSSRLQNKIN